jgi:toxin ParE1/3/4
VRYERSPQADEDLVGIAVFIGSNSPQAADRFIDAAEETFRQLAETPRIGRKCDVANPTLRGLRRWPVRGFENFHLALQIENCKFQIGKTAKP